MNVDQTDLFNDETKLSGSSWRYIYFEFGSTHCELPKKIPFSPYFATKAARKKDHFSTKKITGPTEGSHSLIGSNYSLEYEWLIWVC